MTKQAPVALDIFIQDEHYRLDLDPAIVTYAAEFFGSMDRDLDGGCRMGPRYVENPTPAQRAQYAADRLLSAMETQNESMMQAMLGYILARLPTVRTIRIDTNGEPLNTTLQDAEGRELTED